jgi:hypothetical protein
MRYQIHLYAAIQYSDNELKEISLIHRMYTAHIKQVLNKVNKF